MASDLKQSKTSSDERPTGGNPPTGGRGMYYRQGIRTLKTGVEVPSVYSFKKQHKPKQIQIN